MSGRNETAGPLQGRSIVVTRRREDCVSLQTALEKLGGSVILCPAIRIEFLPHEEFKGKIGDLKRFDWIVFTSRNAVRSVEAFLKGGVGGAKIAAIGEKTASELTRRGLEVAFQASKSTGACLGEELSKIISPEQEVLIPKSQIAESEVAEKLQDGNVWVYEVVTYRTLSGSGGDARALLDFMDTKTPDAVVFASPSAVDGLFEMAGAVTFNKLLRHAALFSIGPVTTDVIAYYGFKVAAEAAPHNVDGIVTAMQNYYQ